MTVVRSLVEAHGGRVWVESDEGRGSRFTFALPSPPRRSGARSREDAGASSRLRSSSPRAPPTSARRRPPAPAPAPPMAAPPRRRAKDWSGSRRAGRSRAPRPGRAPLRGGRAGSELAGRGPGAPRPHPKPLQPRIRRVTITGRPSWSPIAWCASIRTRSTAVEARAWRELLLGYLARGRELERQQHGARADGHRAGAANAGARAARRASTSSSSAGRGELQKRTQELERLKLRGRRSSSGGPRSSSG